MRGASAVLAAGLGLLIAVPQMVQAGSRARARPAISASGAHSCSLQNGQAYCWGDDGYGELGDGTMTSSAVPVAVHTSGVLAGQTLTQISAGNSYDTCALDSAGAAYCWGNNVNGQLGDGTTTSSDVPVAVDTSGVLAGKTLTQISAGYNGTCALDTAGAAYCWGGNLNGELGDGTTTGSDVPVAVDTSGVLAGQHLVQISTGTVHACALDSAGTAYCWGGNGSGQLGDPAAGDSAVPVAVDKGGVLAGQTLTQITAGYHQTCALDRAGAAYCWGNDFFGQLGDGTNTSSAMPVAVATSGVLAGQPLARISTNFYQTCAVAAAGAAYCWGGNPDGELGDGTTTDSNVPVAVVTGGVLAGKTMTQISAGDDNTCALDSGGAGYCWGGNLSGELGDGPTIVQSSVPVAVDSFAPRPPGGVAARAGSGSALLSWAVPVSLGTGTLTGYIATATPGGRFCATRHAYGCTIDRLSNGTTYRVTVVTRTTVGTSAPSRAVSVTPHSPAPPRAQRRVTGRRARAVGA
jgi:alpha-tubulin suppressor-like RCC1 family protein